MCGRTTNDAGRGRLPTATTTWGMTAVGAATATAAATAEPAAPNMAKNAMWCNSTPTSTKHNTIHTRATQATSDGIIRTDFRQTYGDKQPICR